MDKADLIAEITQAFDGVSREDGVTLHQARVIDDRGTPEEEAEARQKDTETRWQDVPKAEIRFKEALFPFFDPKGLRYYLPVYLLCHLKYQDAADYPGGHEGMVLFHLGMGLPALDEWRKGRFSVLSHAQARAVAHFLQFEAEQERMAWDGEANDIDRILDDYWGQFL